MKQFLTENEFGVGEVRSWASLLDDNCREQAEAISRVPILEGYLALMPDAHHGFGPPVGSALLTRDAVMPYAVGVDIGCGMIALETDLKRDRLAGHEGRILGKIREYIPSGVQKGWRRDDAGQMVTQHTEPVAAAAAFFDEHGPATGFKLLSRGDPERTARAQFGTLGSGNHFVEVCENDEHQVWIVLHSGSRGIGNQLATAHFNLAKASCNTKLENNEFSFFRREQRDAYEGYLADMLWAQAYAFAQREAMLDATVRAVTEGASVQVGRLTQVNCHHNYAEEIEPGLWLTRKGAIDASVNKLGVIPGSMGAATYIVRGKGNTEAYNTSPHGAGRLLGRNAAKKALNLDEFRSQMAGKTWLDRDAAALLDEAPFAYKPIETVIADSADLVEPVTVLSQFINYKGL